MRREKPSTQRRSALDRTFDPVLHLIEWIGYGLWYVLIAWWAS